MKLSESTLLAITTAIAGVAALFCLIGLTTPKWLRSGHGLWNCDSVCSSSAATLTILALLCLVSSFVLLVVLLIRAWPRKLRFVPLALLIIATLLLLIAKASYLRHFRVVGYSYELIVTAHAFAFVASVVLAFWFGTIMGDRTTTTTSTIRSSVQSPTIVLPRA